MDSMESLGGCGIYSKLCALRMTYPIMCSSCSCKVVLSLQTLPPRADTESNRRCRMEWGWLARLVSIY